MDSEVQGLRRQRVSRLGAMGLQTRLRRCQSRFNVIQSGWFASGRAHKNLERNLTRCGSKRTSLSNWRFFLAGVGTRKFASATPNRDKAVAALTKELRLYRNLTFQIWNEFDYRAVDYAKIVKNVDPKRLVTNSTGYAGVLGSVQENSVMDYLTPHTTRQSKNKHWVIAPAELAYLIARYKKPVVDDEPGALRDQEFRRTVGTHVSFRSRRAPVRSSKDRRLHHLSPTICSQLGYGDPSIPPSGIPDPEFSPYHKTVFEFLALRDRYFPSGRHSAVSGQPKKLKHNR